MREQSYNRQAGRQLRAATVQGHFRKAAPPNVMLSEAKHLRLVSEQTLRFAQGDSQVKTVLEMALGYGSGTISSAA